MGPWLRGLVSAGMRYLYKDQLVSPTIEKIWNPSDGSCLVKGWALYSLFLGNQYSERKNFGIDDSMSAQEEP